MNDLYISRNCRVGMVAYTCNLGTLEVEAVWSVCFFFKFGELWNKIRERFLEIFLQFIARVLPLILEKH